ncbi:hypothetical protein PsorP6_010658 [Peronosclerospora sorghi]|uniref:Uncharacterized protein n=1 Tax=Peronosclerospora sorghi TaxID=230839 RepID=A0ACC0VX27_9STRA|nr:hypothetical protein PsorP6_010658 [Peronosclerospora sorghi]
MVPYAETLHAYKCNDVPPRRRLEDFYDLQRDVLGRGHFAVVRRARCRRTDTCVAIKTIKRLLADPTRLRAEIAVLRRVQPHQNIVELLDVFETTREVHLVLELCTGGELFERLATKGAYAEDECVRHVRDMARAVQYLHEYGSSQVGKGQANKGGRIDAGVWTCDSVHRDLKPENILLSTADEHEAVVKVADFGLAKVLLVGTKLTTKCGTWGYSAPEMISGSDATFGYDDKVDSWSLGSILYILLCGYHPFDPKGDSSDNELIANIKACKFQFHDDAGWASISHGAKDLVRHLLVLDPDRRFTMNQVLEHPWLTTSFSSVPQRSLSSTSQYELRARDREHTKHKAACGFHDDRNDEDECVGTSDSAASQEDADATM